MRHSAVLHPFLNNVGGSETVCVSIIKTLLDAGHRVDLLSTNNPTEGGLPWKDVFSKVNHVPLNSIRPGQLTTYLRYLTLWPEIRRKSDLRPDCLFLTQEVLPGVSCFKTALKILYVHYPQFYGEREQQFGLIRRSYVLPLSRIVERELSRMDVILCNSQFTKSAILSAWRRYSLPDPIVLNPAPLTSSRDGLRWEERNERVVYVARFAPFKRHEVFRRLADMMPTVSFLSVGSYEPHFRLYLAKLLHRKPTNYSVALGVSPNKLTKLYETSKIYVHLARNEHFGIAPIEAMSAGCVTLAHDSGGPMEYVPSELRWKTVDELQLKLEHLLKDHSRWTYWHEVCKEISKQFTFERFSRGLTAILG